MEKKYQVFVSSTYIDLIEERQEVMQALLELDCIPVGMELFPAADEEQWSLIKRLIDDCDYYILIVGGRYGSVNDEGISYTQMEYEYALKIGIPVISFLHKNPGNIPAIKTEETSEGRQRLIDFQELVKKKLCKYWETSQELGSVVSRSLVKLIKDKPGIGWVKGDIIPSDDLTKEILFLKNENDRLKDELLKSKNFAPEGTDYISSGEELFEITYRIYFRTRNFDEDYKEKSVKVSWDKIFSLVSPYLLAECSDSEFMNLIVGIVRSIDDIQISIILEEELKQKKSNFKSIIIRKEDFQTIKIQFLALGYICKGNKKRPVQDKGNYWGLTPYGETLMTRLRAIKKQ